MPNKENIQKWVDALRSGEYKQVKRRLSDGVGYCCLGVACEVAIKSGLNVRVGTDYDGDTTYDDWSTSLPDSVQAWLDVDDNPELGMRSAAAWNDHYGKSFAEIADMIEAEYLR